MHHAEADEFGALEAWNQPEHALLLTPFDLRLESDEAEMIARQIVLAELHRRVRLATDARIDETDRLHRSESQRVAPAMRHHLDRQTPFKEACLVEVVHGGRLRADERIVEPLIFLSCERTVQVIALPIVHAACGLVRLKADTTGTFECGGVGSVRLPAFAPMAFERSCGEARRSALRRGWQPDPAQTAIPA